MMKVHAAVAGLALATVAVFSYVPAQASPASEDAWQLGYCVAEEWDAASERAAEDPDFGTGSHADVLSDRPCTLQALFGYGDLREKHGLTGNENHETVWRVLKEKEPGFAEDVIRFADGYGENFVNQ